MTESKAVPGSKNTSQLISQTYIVITAFLSLFATVGIAY